MTRREKVYMGATILAMISIILGVTVYFVLFGKKESNQPPIKIAEEKIVDDCVLERRKLAGVRRGK